MIEFLAENAGTILIGLAVAGLVTASAAKVIRDAKKGKCAGCAGGCPHRPRNKA